MEFLGGIFVGIWLGILFGITIGQIITQYQTKKNLKNEQCKNCKHFEDCLGGWKKIDNNGKCKIYQPREQDLSEDVKQSLSEQIRKTNREVSKIGFKLESLEEAQEIDRDIISEDIEHLSKEVFKDEQNR